MSDPTIAVVVVNYNGGDLTLECLRSLVATKWPAPRLRVLLVDNASSDGVVARVRKELPVVDVIENTENRGFGAGCNRGIRAAGHPEFVALVNNDASVGPEWLAPLVEALETDPSVGAACPKILFAGQFLDLELRSETTRRERGDRRDLGVLVAGARVDGVDVWRRVQRVDGTWGVEPGKGDGAEWTGAVAHLRVPAPDHGGAAIASLLLSADSPRAVELRSGDDIVALTIGSEPTWYDVRLRGPGVDVINNVGTELTPGGFGADRGFQERDDGQYDTPADVFAWCGAAVLLRSQYLADVGLFDERFFLYYEDLELAWRGAEHGWRYRYIPDSVVRHVHSAASVDGSAFKRFYDERNHLLLLARHGSLGSAAGAAARSLLVSASYAWRDLASPSLRGERIHVDSVKPRLAAWGSALRFAPAMVRDRHRRSRAD